MLLTICWLSGMMTLIIATEFPLDFIVKKEIRVC